SSTRSPRSSTWSRRRSISLRRDTTIRSHERSSRRSSAGVCDIEHETRGRRPGRFEEMNRIRSILAAGTIFVAAASFTGCRESAAVETNGGSEIAYAERRTLDIRAEAAGLVEPIRIVDVKSKASGASRNIYGETGDFVQRGALLAEVDPRDVRNALAQAEAALEGGRARRAPAAAQRRAADARRDQERRGASGLTEQECENPECEAANARAQCAKAQTNLELARERMNDVTIRAPLDGTIIQKSVEIGQIIQSASQNISGGTTLF